MATNATWTVVFDDKKIVKQAGDAAGAYYKLVDASHDSFWNDPKFSNIWAIQYGTDDTNEEVEYRDTTPHTSHAAASLGDFNDFITQWDAAHLAGLQDFWDNDNVEGETAEEKIARIGERPTAYASESV